MALCGGSGPPARRQCGSERLGRGLEGAETSGRHGGRRRLERIGGFCPPGCVIPASETSEALRLPLRPGPQRRALLLRREERPPAQRYLSSVSERRSNVKGRPDFKARGVDWPRTGAAGWFSVVCDLTDWGERRAYVLGPAEAILTRSHYCNKRTADVSAERHATPHTFNKK